MRRSLLALFLVLGLLAAACGGGEDGASDSGDGETEVTESAAEPDADAGTEEAPDPATSTEDSATDPADAGQTTTTEGATPAGDVDDDTAGDATDSGDDTAQGESIRFGDLVLTDPAEVTSARFEGVFTMVPDDSGEIPGPVEMTFGGAFNQATQSSEMSMDFGALLEAAPADELAELPPEMAEIFTEPLQLITIGDTAYMNWGFFSLFLGADGWIELPADDTGDVTGGFGFGVDSTSPYESLEQLDDAQAEFVEVGRESVNGADTTHYRAVVDFEKLKEQMSAEEVAELEEAFGADQPQMPIDVWIGDDGFLYRYQFEFTADGSEDMEGLASVTATFEMFEFNTDVVIEPPDPSEVTSIEDLGGFFDFES
jgi:hypothetical protein